HQVRRNGRVIRSDGLMSRESLRLLLSLPKLRIRAGTLGTVVAHLVREKIDPISLARRPCFQALLLWDIFTGLYRPHDSPVFATFFTNHVASIMHRYWKDVFPGDFQDSVHQCGPHSATMLFALKVLDGILDDPRDGRPPGPCSLQTQPGALGSVRPSAS